MISRTQKCLLGKAKLTSKEVNKRQVIKPKSRAIGLEQVLMSFGGSRVARRLFWRV